MRPASCVSPAGAASGGSANENVMPASSTTASSSVGAGRRRAHQSAARMRITRAISAVRSRDASGAARPVGRVAPAGWVARRFRPRDAASPSAAATAVATASGSRVSADACRPGDAAGSDGWPRTPRAGPATGCVRSAVSADSSAAGDGWFMARDGWSTARGDSSRARRGADPRVRTTPDDLSPSAVSKRRSSSDTSAVRRPNPRARAVARRRRASAATTPPAASAPRPPTTPATRAGSAPAGAGAFWRSP